MPLDTDPAAPWIFVADQLHIHKSESVVRLIAERCNLDVDFGVKGHSGILQAMATRAAFLQQTDHRIRFVFTPKHTSWLNQVEMWFSIVARRVLKRASFTSVDDLQKRVLAFIEYFHTTPAKPFQSLGVRFPEACFACLRRLQRSFHSVLARSRQSCSFFASPRALSGLR